MNQQASPRVFERHIRSAFALAVVIVLLLSALIWDVSRRSDELSEQLTQSHALMDGLLRVRAHTLDIELSTQAYRLSGDVVHLADRDIAMQRREDVLALVRQLGVGRAGQADLWTALRQVIDERIAISRRIETLRRSQGQAAADAFVTSAPLVQTRRRVDALLGQMEALEARRMATLDAEQAQARTRAVASGVVVSIVMLVLLGATWALVYRRVHSSQSHLLSVIDNVPAMIAFVDAQQRYVYVNARYRQRFAPDLVDLAGRTVREVLGEDRYAVAGPLIAKALRGEPLSYDWQPFDSVWQTISYVPERDEHGQVSGYFVLGTDITERRRAEQALREGEERLARVLDGADQGYWEWDLATQHFSVSARWETMLGYAPGELRVQPEHWPDLVHPEDLPVAQASIERHLAGLSPSHEAEIRCRTKAGEWIWILTRGRIVRRAGDGTPLLMSGTHTDITPLKQHQAELDRVAHFDALTGLPNRRLMTDRLEQALLRARRNGLRCAVCLLDLDGFKAINDQHGHAVGDQVLVGISGHLKAILRAEDTLARLGGDEFVLLLSDLASADDCTQILERVLQALVQPVAAEGLLLHTSASIGASLYPDDDVDADTLLRHADQAMYLAKQAGKNRYQLFDLEIDRRTHARRDLLAEVALGLERDEFVLHYQPKVDLHSGRVIGAEGLIRWQHPQRGLLQPDAFLPELVGSDLEQPLGDWVQDAALRQIQAWADAGLTLGVSINVSANHLLKADFCARLADALARHPAVRPSDLVLEVLETAAIQDMEQAVQILHDCTALGVTFALDDFGTGYSSLSYLRRLPVHRLKIDQSFVRTMLSDAEDLAIVRSVIELASVFRRDAIAEGIETPEHMAALRALGCRYGQGYGIARPMPAEAMPDWCREWEQSQAGAIS
ncbi:MAG: hypothetical protein RIQ60_310 [Pseudomonadota bacterium]